MHAEKASPAISYSVALVSVVVFLCASIRIVGLSIAATTTRDLRDWGFVAIGTFLAVADVQGWMIGTENDESDSLVGFELFDDKAAAGRHAKTRASERIQAQVRALDGAPARSEIRPTATNLRSSG